MKKIYLCCYCLISSFYPTLAQKIHLIGLVDTLSTESLHGNAYVVKQLRELTTRLVEENMNPTLLLLSPAELADSDSLMAKLKALSVGADDVILCYNAAQAYYTPSDTMPVLRFGTNTYSDIKCANLRDLLLEKKARLTVIINECIEFSRQSFTGTTNISRGIPRGYLNKAAINALFLQTSGSLLVLSSKQGDQTIITEDNGGIFAQSFFSHLYDSLFSEMPTWEAIMQNVVKETTKKSADFGEHQVPVYESVLTYEKTKNQVKTETLINVTMNTYKVDDFEIELRTDKGVRELTYFKCDTLHYWLKSSKPCFLRLIDIWSDGRMVALLDNYELPAEKVNQWIEIKAANNHYFRCGSPFGTEYLLSFASEKRFTDLSMNINGGTRFLKDSLEKVLSITRDNNHVVLEDKLLIVTKDISTRKCN